MSQQELLDNFASLPAEAQRQVADFIASLRRQYSPASSENTAKSKDLGNEEFIGMWRDRQDMGDSTAWVRNLREKEWTNER